ncbi:methyl-accepting chemotaxis protein [Tyzzerella sp. OttesenSCG-928-J15]|nr:methyl-accepting chemotaxis protein [Tyzzerella sp. OttesenSCG-928-J15]
MKNLRIGTKITLCLTCALALMLVISLTSIFSSRQTGADIEDVELYSGLQSSANDLMHIINETRITAGIAYVSPSESVFGDLNKQIMYCDLRLEKLNEYAMTDARLSEYQEEIENFELLYSRWRSGVYGLMEGIDVSVSPIDSQALLEHMEASASLKRDNLLAHEILSNLLSDIDHKVDNMLKNTKAFNNTSLRIVLVISILAIALAGLLTGFAVKSITKPLTEIVDIAENVSNGQLNVNIQYTSKDEIGILADKFRTMVGVINQLVTGMNEMYAEQEQGDYEYYLDENQFSGAYQAVAGGVNQMVRSHVHTTLDMVDILEAYNDGDFSKEMQQLPGKKAKINEAINNVSKNLYGISNAINQLVLEAMDGRLDKNIDESTYKGEWLKMASGLNDLMATIDKPIKEAENSLKAVVLGNLDSHIEGDYKGAFENLKDSINATLEQLRAIIGDISRITTILSHDDYDIDIDMEYNGDFYPIKEGLVKIIDRINIVMKDVSATSSQIEATSNSMSESSSNLSEGAVRQSEVVEQVRHAVIEIAEKAKQSSQTAKNASDSAALSSQRASDGSRDMESMLVAMEAIATSANNISSVIKVIEDIAFQTNLLALNASVEAARAGEHGKGFAVVADEVGMLAKKSQDAVQNTAKLIESTTSSVQEGVEIAKKTSEIFNDIVSGVKDISEMISDISTSASSQEAEISDIDANINVIFQITEANKEISQQTLLSAESLSGLSENFRTTVAKFNLK